MNTQIALYDPIYIFVTWKMVKCVFSESVILRSSVLFLITIVSETTSTITQESIVVRS